MLWEDLRKQAKLILENEPSGDFDDVSFKTRSGGAPTNKVGVPEVHRADIFRYRTTANGDAYAGEVVVRCRDTGVRDANGRKIYQAENGTVFVYRYVPGSPYSFDYGVLEEPEFSA